MSIGQAKGGLGGVECDAHDGCHLREGDLFIDMIDPIRLTPETWFTTGAAKRTLIDRRQEQSIA